MRYPNKLNSYHDSVLSKMSPLLSVVKNERLTVVELYQLFKKEFGSITEFIGVLDCLYAMQRIEYDNVTGEMIYVA